MSIIDRARIIRHQIEHMAESLSDETALDYTELFAEWKEDTDYATGDRKRYDGKLYKCRQPHHSQAHYPPTLVPALWEEVAEPGQGDTPDNPIPYNNNMELIDGKYYSQFDVVYHCIRSTGVAVYNNLADLVGIYVEVYVP